MAPRFPSDLFAEQIVAARYYCPELPRSPQALEVVCAGWEDCRSDYELVRREFPWHAVELVARGEGWLEVGAERHRLHAGSLFAYGPETSLRITADPLRPFLKYFVTFTGPDALALLEAGPLRAGEVRQALYPQELQDVLERVVAEGNHRTERSAAIACDYLRILLQKLHDGAGDGAGAPGAEGGRSLASFLRAKAYLEEHCARLAHAEDAAHELGVTPEHLCRLFRHFSRSTPYRFLVQQRISLAVDLLLGSDLLVKEVAERTGFQDAYHFSRVFKRMQGLSPARFQRLHRRGAAGR